MKTEVTMFESCHSGDDDPGDEVSEGRSGGPRCTDVAEKLAQLFGWRQTYKVEKLQRALADSVIRRNIQQQQLQLQHRSLSISKSADAWVVVHSLQSQNDGGILDPDDRLLDVADDREQIIANFEDAGDGPPPHHGGGDGASGSSVGTGSPDIFQSENPKFAAPYTRTDIEVTGEQIASGLQVRRGSEPALNQLPITESQQSDPTKRWSATPIILDGGNGDCCSDRLRSHRKEPVRNGGFLQEEELPHAPQTIAPPRRFVRDGSSRLSMQFLQGGDGLRWADAAERAQSKSLPRDHRRKEPLGQATVPQPLPPSNNNSNNHHQDSDLDDETDKSVEYVVLHNDSGPLGIHVVPDYDRLGKDRGLLVQGIEPGGRIDRDGRLAVYDRIIEINGQNLLNMSFQRVQEIFKDSLRCPELRLRVIKHQSNNMEHGFKKPPPPVFPRSISKGLDEKDSVAMVEGEERAESVRTKIATVSPTKKVSPAAVPPRTVAASLQTANTRKIGRKIELELTKGPQGLGFSITTRDNPAGGNCPIYIKNILPKGAAVEDGRLRPGDRLLEVNGIEMTGKTQAEAVTVLRNAPPGSKVRIVVSRQEDVASSPRLPRQMVASELDPFAQQNSSGGGGLKEENGSSPKMTTAIHPVEPTEKANDDGLVFPWKHREILTFDIPVHDTEKAGLGVSVKGKTSANHNNPSGGSLDLGIFVKSVLHGGAASRDGRLRTNDQLLNVNGISLLAQSNSDAMETLRRAMLHTEGPIPGVISLTVARRASSPGPSSLINGHQSGRESVSSHLTSSSGTETFGCSSGSKPENEGYTPDNSGTSENSDNTVIFLPYKEDGESSRDSNHISNNSPDKSSHDIICARNPVIDRLTGQIPPTQDVNPLRNESYYRATHDTWNTTMLLSGGGGSRGDKLTSPTVNLPSGEMVLIEEEYIPPHSHRAGRPVPGRRAETEQDGRSGSTVGGCAASDKSSDTHTADVTYASQLSLDEAAGFSRDAFGRQSMSEKRHATLDAKHTDTYQRNKKLREERERQRQIQMQQQQQQMNGQKARDAMKNGGAKANRDLILPSMIRANSIESIISISQSQADSEKSDVRLKNEFGPSLGMKKSSSLESLQTMVQEIQMQEDNDPAYTYRNAQGAVRVIRGRGCNESFRAAVDRSYEAPLSDLRNRIGMETRNGNNDDDGFSPFIVAEEDGPLPSGMPIDCGNNGGHAGGTGFGFNSVRGAPRQSSLNAVLDAKHKTGKKKPGIFKGIGSMFRFGKHRKTLDMPLQVALQQDQEESTAGAVEEEREAARRAAQEEQQRIQEQYRRLMQRQQQMESQNANNNIASQDQEGDSEASFPSAGHHQEGSNSSQAAAQSRSERIHQLRAQHQRRHAERRGQYPLDDREERYEEAIRQRLEQPDHISNQQQGQSSNYDLYGEMTRPGSRVGISDPARFSHYVNYEEIQQHLNKRKEQLSEVQIMQMRLQVQHQRFKVEEESRRQQHYHSQRRDNRELHQRPISNFYEYESIQNVMRANQHREDMQKSNRCQEEGLKTNHQIFKVSHQQDDLRTKNHKSSHHREEASRTNYHREEVMRSNHQHEEVLKVNHRDEVLRANHQMIKQRDDVLRASQQQRISMNGNIDGNSNSLPRKMKQQDNRMLSNNNSSSSYQRQFQPGPNYVSGPHVVNVNGHLRTTHLHDVDHWNNHNGAVQQNGPCVNIPAGTSKINNLSGRPQGPFITHVTIGQQGVQGQTPGSKV